MAPRARKIRGTPRRGRPRPARPAAASAASRETETAAMLARLRDALAALRRALRRLDRRD